jgi:hypothetical protein
VVASMRIEVTLFDILNGSSIAKLENTMVRRIKLASKGVQKRMRVGLERRITILKWTPDLIICHVSSMINFEKSVLTG